MYTYIHIHIHIHICKLFMRRRHRMYLSMTIAEVIDSAPLRVPAVPGVPAQDARALGCQHGLSSSREAYPC